MEPGKRRSVGLGFAIGRVPEPSASEELGPRPGFGRAEIIAIAQRSTEQVQPEQRRNKTAFLPSVTQNSTEIQRVSIKMCKALEVARTRFISKHAHGSLAPAPWSNCDILASNLLLGTELKHPWSCRARRAAILGAQPLKGGRCPEMRHLGAHFLAVLTAHFPYKTPGADGHIPRSHFLDAERLELQLPFPVRESLSAGTKNNLQVSESLSSSPGSQTRLNNKLTLKVNLPC